MIVSRDKWVLDGQVFFGTVQSTAAGGLNSHVQLFNPAASGVKLLIDKIVINGSPSVSIRRRVHNTALTTSVATSTNKNVGGAAPKAELRHQTNATELGSLVGTLSTDGSGHRDVEDIYPVILGEGEGILFVPLLKTQIVIATFEWREA